jgi:hypothetical protein
LCRWRPHHAAGLGPRVRGLDRAARIGSGSTGTRRSRVHHSSWRRWKSAVDPVQGQLDDTSDSSFSSSAMDSVRALEPVCLRVALTTRGPARRPAVDASSANRTEQDLAVAHRELSLVTVDDVTLIHQHQTYDLRLEVRPGRTRTSDPLLRSDEVPAQIQPFATDLAERALVQIVHDRVGQPLSARSRPRGLGIAPRWSGTGRRHSSRPTIRALFLAKPGRRAPGERRGKNGALSTAASYSPITTVGAKGGSRWPSCSSRRRWPSSWSWCTSCRGGTTRRMETTGGPSVL